jgi:peptidyl-tRNA hydrolase
MPALSNPFDQADAARARAEQADPLIMYLVVRRERVPSRPLLLAAAAATTVRADRRFRGDPAWSARCAAWHAGSFRKVTLRANERDWARLLERFALVTGGSSDQPYLAVLPPRARSEVEPFLRSLQAYVIDPADLPAEPEPAAGNPTVLMSVNPALVMSAGKLVAQVAHAALMSADAPEQLGAGEVWKRAVRAWETHELPVRIVPVSSAGWIRGLAELPVVVVTDFGLTEIAPGSRTVLATRPLETAELGPAVALLQAAG